MRDTAILLLEIVEELAALVAVGSFTLALLIIVGAV
jgi:hypothetical protein